MASCDEILQLCMAWSGDKLQVTSLGTSCLVRMPFYDADGDPITIVVSDAPDGYTVNDGGAIAEHLFSLGQHTENTLAFKLLDRLSTAYNLILDRDQGVVRVHATIDRLAEAIFELTKIVLTLTTATAHISVHPYRFRTLGARVRGKIRTEYTQRNILEWVDPHYRVRGVTVDSWPIDFHWKVRQGNEFKDVFVTAIDLNVKEPIQKVEHLTALAVDASASLEGHNFRVVLDKHGQNSMAAVAANYLEAHRNRLGYQLFDFGDGESRDRFISQSEDEVLGQAGNEWRNFWEASRRGSADASSVSRESFDRILRAVAQPLNEPPDQESEET